MLDFITKMIYNRRMVKIKRIKVAVLREDDIGKYVRPHYFNDFQGQWRCDGDMLLCREDDLLIKGDIPLQFAFEVVPYYPRAHYKNYCGWQYAGVGLTTSTDTALLMAKEWMDMPKNYM